MTIEFVDNPIKGRCYVQVTEQLGLHYSQCNYPSKHVLTDGFKRVAVCGIHRDTLFRHNEIWKTQWRERRTEQEERKQNIGSHPIDKYASDQATMGDLITMRGIYDQTIRPEGTSQEEFAQILQWVADQAEIKREQEKEDA